MTERRRSTLNRERTKAHEIPPKSVELEHRIGRLETTLQAVLDRLDTQAKHTIALQAQLDYLSAKMRV